tara:strand:- start:369 stop:1307 length:939 start_codon:yes stop_codon:yes gene_type:complete
MLLTSINNNLILTKNQINETDFQHKFSSLNTRDIRFLNSNAIISHIAVRKDIIIIKLDFVKAIITKNELIFLNTNYEIRDSKIYMDMIKFIISTIETDDSTVYFEFKSLESIFTYIMTIYNDKFDKILPSINEILKITGIDGNNILTTNNYSKKLVNIQNDVSNFQYRVKEIIIVLNELEEEDEDMSGLYLSEKRTINNHNEVEILLETYRKQFEKINVELQKYLRELNNIQEGTNIELAIKRNNYALINTYLSLLSISISISSFIINIFGMNLKNKLEDSFPGFMLVILFSVLIGIIILVIVNYNIEKFIK